MKQNIRAFLIFLSLTVLATWPLVLNLNTEIVDKVDGLLITWIMNWDIHALSLGVNIFNANIFFPFKNTLAFSDYHLLGAVIAWPFVVIFKEPLLAFNINFLLGFILTAYSMYLLVKFLTKDFLVAIFCGILIAFAPIHLAYMTHLQVFSIWPVILAIYFLVKNSYWWYGFLVVVCGLQSPLLAVFCVISGVIYNIKILKKLLLPIFILGVFLVPFFLVSREWHYVRPITDAINFSLQIPDLFNGRADGPHLWMGWVAFIMVIGLTGQIRQIWRRKETRFFLVLAAVSFVLALGPALHIFTNTVHVGPIKAIPLPYAIFYYLIPGFSGFRTPSRWIMLTVVAMVVLIGYFLKGRVNIWKWVLLVLLVLWEIPRPIKFYDVPKTADFPVEQKMLAKNYKNMPIVQFPIYSWWDKDLEVETMREYYSTIHWNPMFNGYSGFSPTVWENEVRWLQKEFPSKESIDFLRSKGVRLVVFSSKIYEIQKDSKLVEVIGK